MLDICLEILFITGICILVLLALIVITILLVFFFPVTYRVRGGRSEEKLQITAKAKWLFGLLRVNYRYPEPGRVVAKALWFTVYDSSASSEAGEDRKAGKERSKKEKKEKKEKRKDTRKAASGETAAESSAGSPASGRDETKDSLSGAGGLEEQKSREEPAAGESGQVKKGKFFQLFEKIKYTIHNIYDKIREIWENISYYTALLQEEDTKRLFAHISFRLGKILKNIRPRHLKADILFGTGSPDTTGYLFGAYCMFSPVLGSGLQVTPDFERAVCRAEFDVSGHITLWVLTVNALKLFLDKRLKAFIGKLKREKEKKLEG